MAGKDEKAERKPTAGERAEARIERGNRRAEKAEEELAEGRERRVREGDTFESLDAREDDPRRRVKVVAFDGDQAVVENLSTGRHSRIAVDRLAEPHYKLGV